MRAQLARGMRLWAVRNIKEHRTVKMLGGIPTLRTHVDEAEIFGDCRDADAFRDWLGDGHMVVEIV